jgi:protein-disulfide isomerase
MWASIRVAALVCVTALTGCPADTHNESAKPVSIDVERFRVELRDDDHALGGDKPLVTVVLFSDYACVPCGRSWKVMKNLVEDYGEDLRVVYRSYTVAGHLHGDTAAEAAFAAGDQGKFWDMHWALFENQDQFSRPSLRGHAEAIGLDVPKFFDDVDTGAFTGRRMRDRRQATELGIRALPVAFINGLFLMGAQPDEHAWHAIIDEEMKRSRRMMQDGTPRPDLYAAYMKTAKRGLVGESPEAEELRTQRMVEKAAAEAEKRVTRKGPESDQRYAVPTEGAPALGPDDAPVVLVEFLDFRCPYCRQTYTEVLPKIREKYPEKVRIVVRHLPLEIHPVAPGTARASVAAFRQGKFWDFHDALFENEDSVGRQRFVEIARKIGLDVDRFQKDLDSPEVAKVVEDDLALSRSLGVSGTPGFFINGRYLHGAHDFGTFESIIDEELQRADEAIKGGTPRARVHAALMSEALKPDSFPNPTPTGGDG